MINILRKLRTNPLLFNGTTLEQARLERAIKYLVIRKCRTIQPLDNRWISGCTMG